MGSKDGEVKDGKARNALASTFILHRERLRRFIARLAIRPEDVDDILQETFLNAFRVENPSAIESPRKVLAELSHKTQVIFFTHHRHLVELAQNTIDASELILHTLERY